MPSPIPTGRFNHATLNCRQVARSVDFYIGVLGFRQAPRPSFSFPGAWLYRDGLGMMLHLNEDPHFNPPRDTINSRKSHLAFRVEDIDATVDLLGEHGVECVVKTLPDHGYRQIFFLDPDGNVLELGEWPDVESLVAAL